ncbi:hypothetical protein [Streptomyces virginiae]|uniref:hypothetical protein n=1 Tax=Streptomyces virginiae TaxID=1961 RepID=UPI002254F0D2|nr:hypothetical protein [Streptomyces virginiae]MCX4961881.1 hypothetical protein [Streptomyces virginiae]MCX5180171.1 hypothetical protein [Streptomyces virginiae]
MALHIDDVGLLILAVGLLVGHAVHKHTKAAAGAASKGGIVGAIAAAAAVITALFLLFGGGGSTSAGPDSRPAGHALASHQVSAVRSA